jgi:hypothetical protein
MSWGIIELLSFNVIYYNVHDSISLYLPLIPSFSLLNSFSPRLFNTSYVP